MFIVCSVSLESRLLTITVDYRNIIASKNIFYVYMYLKNKKIIKDNAMVCRLMRIFSF